jgi:hypothetical protein
MTLIMIKGRWFLALAPFALLFACGGQSFTEGDDSAGEGGEGGSSAGKGGTGSGAIGSGGNPTAGRGSSGTANGGTGFAGTGFAGTGFAGTGFAGTGFAGNLGTGGSVCCTAAPVCPPGEREVPSADGGVSSRRVLLHAVALRNDDLVPRSDV